MIKIPVVISLWMALLCANSIFASDLRVSYRLFFPEIELFSQQYEGIEEVRVTVRCGHIAAISFIPNDWNMQVVQAISAVEKFNASAGHGASKLKAIQALNGSIQITAIDEACFEVSATILISGAEQTRQIELSRPGLKLVPER